MLGACWYCSIPELCDACVARWIEIHRGNAAATGRSWGRYLTEIVDRASAPPWPAFEASEKLRAIATRRIAPLVSNVPRVRLELARACAAAAGEVYEAWRVS